MLDIHGLFNNFPSKKPYFENILNTFDILAL
jgi:hypothetical protein